jgi:membrane protease YdiL (CAAX protease family)
MSRAPATGADGGAGTQQAAAAPALGQYLSRSSAPLVSLVFLLPFVAVYELGTRLVLADPVAGTPQVIAFTMLQRAFAPLGPSARHLPALAVISMLFAWHLARKDGWTVRFSTLLGMGVESIALGVPPIVFGLLLRRFLPLGGSDGEPLTTTVIFAFGAGVYEEFVFRLILCTFLAILLKNVLRLNAKTSTLLLVPISASLFSAYHYLGPESFTWGSFVFRMGAGIYFTALLLRRGFGITCGSHIAYDILISFF